MGIIAQGKGLWDALFTRTQRQVLGLLFGHPGRSFYANQVVRLAGVGTGSVQRELARLAGAGLLSVTRIGNQKHYQANPDSPIYAEVRSIVVKTFGALDVLRSTLMGMPGRIDGAFLFGPSVRPGAPPGSDLNLLLVSPDLEYADLRAGLIEAENRIGRNIEPVLLTPDEFRDNREQGNEMLRDILEQTRVLLIGQLPD